MALAYRAITKRSIISSIRWTKRHWEEYQEFILYRASYGVKLVRRTKPEYARKELLCQGFVPISEFKMKTKSGWYAYIMSNSLLPGETLIYPEHFAHDYRPHFRKGCKYVHEALSEIGLEGYTRIYYTAYKNGIAK
jgi:hypothetical protein